MEDISKIFTIEFVEIQKFVAGEKKPYEIICIDKNGNKTVTVPEGKR